MHSLLTPTMSQQALDAFAIFSLRMMRSLERNKQNGYRRAQLATSNANFQQLCSAKDFSYEPQNNYDYNNPSETTAQASAVATISSGTGALESMKII